MSTIFPCPTKTYHTESYPAIDPKLPQLSSKDKNIVITGGGSGVGVHIATAFAKSGASNIAILGRTTKSLHEAKQRIEAEHVGSKITPYAADLTDEASLHTALSAFAKSVGQIDVLVANAGYLSALTSVMESNFAEWWQGFEVNVKGNYNLVKAFLPHAAKDAAIVNISTAVVHVPYFKGQSGYHTSKLAAAKLFDYVHEEHPELFVLNVHPGVLPTKMSVKAREGGTKLPPDDSIELPASFVVWAVSPEARFLNGKFVWAHWDVDELKAMAKEIEGTDKFTLGLLGWK